jgi:hypothetical protein
MAKLLGQQGPFQAENHQRALGVLGFQTRLGLSLLPVILEMLIRIP